jgi:endonuclease/exonuclease/phosphatase family metal-dependent hydrolase
MRTLLWGANMKAWSLFLPPFFALLLLTAQTPRPATITIASWNIEQFGKTKSSDPVRLARIAKVIKEFDVIAIQKIVHAESEGQDVVDRLTSELRGEHRRTYDHVLGPRTGCPGGRVEQYAVLFDSQIVELVDSRTVEDDASQPYNMCRDPLVVKLRLRDTSATLTVTLIAVHTDPSPAYALESDLNALARIYQSVQAYDPEDDDVVLLGDLNAAPSDFEDLGAVPDIVYAVPDTGSMVQGSSRNDNIVFQWQPTSEDYTGRAGVFRVPQFLSISEEEAKRLSDHQPVFAVFFTRRDTR